MDQSYYNETLKKICELRSDFEKSLESIYEKVGVFMGVINTSQIGRKGIL